MMNRVQVGQKRAGTPLTNQIVKQRQAMPAQRNTRPAQAKDVKEKIHKTDRPPLSVISSGFAEKCTVKNEFFKKFPVVTHKEIQIEIVPSELAKKK